MPLYILECPECGKLVEELLEKDEPLPKCPECGVQMQKKIAMPGGFILKGKGFYKPSKEEK